MAQYIYSRVSTDKQQTENQLSKLRELYPNAAVFEETASGVKARPVLQAVLGLLQPGDWLCVYALDRLGRRTSEVLTLIEELEKRGVVLKSLREGISYDTPVGKLVTSILVSVAQLERDLISERTKSALEAKRKQGIVGGRRPKFSAEQVERARELRACGRTLREIASETGISVTRISELTKAAA